MYLTQNAQILAEHKPWNHENESHHHHHLEKNLMKKWPGMDEKISDQVSGYKLCHVAASLIYSRICVYVHD